ncbi:hypothetical protein DERF_011987 [Dermatophagoides farinae]|uniref:Uncharacterized protein n=1 Tax=Dermatophagoides farinae TaxID=6954 RepID=A0A922HNR8_DERFA|nr:hypothetical protein DERF_011987 [Dermatophagoides farinae]
MAQIYRSKSSSSSLLLITIISTTLISYTCSLPVSSSSSSSSSSLVLKQKPSESPFCQSHANINQVYNIGNDIYLALNSRSIYRFDVKQKQLYKHKYDINELFGKIFSMMR